MIGQGQACVFPGTVVPSTQENRPTFLNRLETEHLWTQTLLTRIFTTGEAEESF